MFKFAAPLLVSVSLASGAYASCTGPGIESIYSEAEIANFKAQSADVPYSDGIYWHAEKDGTDIYVAGTMHIHSIGLAEVAARFEPELTQADLVMFEMTPEDGAELEQALMSEANLIMLPDNQTLSQALPPEKWHAVSSALSAIGVNPADVAPLQPWIVNMNFLLPPCAMAALQAGQPGMEELLQDMIPVDTPMASLEDWRSSLAFFYGPDIEQQADELLLSLVTLPYLEPVTISTIEAYFDGDPQRMIPAMDGLADLIAPELKASYETFMQRLEDELLEKRNSAWMAEIENAATDYDSIFVAVGAMHLGGESGVVTQLAANGWTVSAMAD